MQEQARGFHALLRRSAVDGFLAAGFSALVLAWRGRVENASAAAPLNAVSHWLWPQEALRQDEASMRFTATGTAVHFASAMLWVGVYEWLRAARRRPTAGNAFADAAAVTALAATVDLRVVPKRLSPGFEERLQPSSVGLVYLAFALGLAAGGVAALRNGE